MQSSDESYFKVGDKVYRDWPYDGSPKQGFPNRTQVFTITKIEDHISIDGPRIPNAVCFLEPGNIWAFYWNLSPMFRKEGDIK